MTFPDHATMLSLAALHNGHTRGARFSLLECGTMGVDVPGGIVPIHGHVLAALTERGWVALGEDNPDGLPSTIEVTEQGRYALRRYMQKLKVNSVRFFQLAQP